MKSKKNSMNIYSGEKSKNHDYADLSLLSPTEIKVIRLVAEFKTSKEIAEILDVHYRTIENHRTNINRKLSLTGKESLIKFAVSNKDLL